MKIVLGFSGGVDSAVSAILLRQMGNDVYGLYMDNADEEARQYALDSAALMGIPLKVVDVKKELDEKVCSYFTEAYLRGETPNPCIMCNPGVKFKALIDYADAIGAEYVSTGHYARAENGELFKGQPENDQSYMLCRLKREQLKRLYLPLGPYNKSEIRAFAEDFGIPSANKPDSMEICFIPDKDYISWLSKRCELPSGGNFVFNGQVIGPHEGIYRYTVGQRRPGLLNERKVYISKIHPESNEIELALWEDLFKTEVYARDFNWLIDKPQNPIKASVRVRHTKWETPDCIVYPQGDEVRIVCSEPVRAPAAGQSAVLYDGDKVLGGGFIYQK